MIVSNVPTCFLENVYLVNFYRPSDSYKSSGLSVYILSLENCGMRPSLIAILLTARAFPATALLSTMYNGKEKVRRYLPSKR